MKKSLRLAVLLVPLLTTWAFAGIYYEAEGGPVPAGTPPLKVVYYISGTKMRSEGQASDGTRVVIARLDEAKRYYVRPQSKVYWESTIHKLSPQEDAQVQVSVTKTGETKKIGPYDCTRYDVTIKGMPGMGAQGVRSQYWTTAEVDVAEEFAKFRQAEAGSQSSKTAEEMGKLEGFTMQKDGTDASGRKMTITVTTVRKQDVPDSMFEVPADYTKMAMPDAEATPPAAPPQGGAGGGKGE